jgi:DNA-binding transcriptional MocR family regulator
MLFVRTGGKPPKLSLATELDPGKIFPMNAHQPLYHELAERMGSAACRYSMAPGRNELRIAVARRLLTAGVKATPDDIVTTLGATETLALVLRAMTRPGDVVAVEIPTYFGVLHLLKDVGLKVVATLGKLAHQMST